MGVKEILKVFPGLFFSPSKAISILGSKSFDFSLFFLVIASPILLAGAYGRVLGEIRVAELDQMPPMILSIVSHFCVLVIGIFLGSLMLTRLAPRYGIFPDYFSMTKIATISYLPVCLALFVSGFGFGGYILVLLGLLVSVYFFGLGTRIVYDFPQNRLLGFVLIAFIVFLGVMYFFLFVNRSIVFAFKVS